jgi:hypothetical protein
LCRTTQVSHVCVGTHGLEQRRPTIVRRRVGSGQAGKGSPGAAAQHLSSLASRRAAPENDEVELHGEHAACLGKGRRVLPAEANQGREGATEREP